MKIGLDVNPLVTGHQYRGIGVYVKNLLKTFLESENGHTYYLYRSFGNLSVPKVLNVISHLMEKEKTPLSQLADEDNIEILHITDFYHPIYTLSGLQQLKHKGIKVVISLADVIPLRFPEHYPAEKSFIENHLVPLLPLADKVIAISHATANDLIKYFGLPPDAVSVTHLGVDLDFFSYLVKENDRQVLLKYGIKHPYFLYVGGFDWRKNCETMLKAFFGFLQRAETKHQLVLIGNDPPTPVMQNILKDCTEQPIMTGFIPADDLPPLYRHATALLFPSRFEGFGLPVLEAMACGCPIISSNKASLPEIVGEGGLLLDPDDLEGWIKAMHILSTNSVLRKTLQTKGLEQAQSFTWEACARKTWKVYSTSKSQG